MQHGKLEGSHVKELDETREVFMSIFETVSGKIEMATESVEKERGIVALDLRSSGRQDNVLTQTRSLERYQRWLVQDDSRMNSRTVEQRP